MRFWKSFLLWNGMASLIYLNQIMQVKESVQVVGSSTLDSNLKTLHQQIIEIKKEYFFDFQNWRHNQTCEHLRSMISNFALRWMARRIYWTPSFIWGYHKYTKRKKNLAAKKQPQCIYNLTNSGIKQSISSSISIIIFTNQEKFL